MCCGTWEPRRRHKLADKESKADNSKCVIKKCETAKYVIKKCVIEKYVWIDRQ